MAAGRLPKPGSKLGPCLDEQCGHSDCATNRELAATGCYYCGEPIGYEAPFYDVTDKAASPDKRFAHAGCHEQELEIRSASRTKTTGNGAKVGGTGDAMITKDLVAELGGLDGDHAGLVFRLISRMIRAGNADVYTAGPSHTWYLWENIRRRRYLLSEYASALANGTRPSPC